MKRLDYVTKRYYNESNEALQKVVNRMRVWLRELRTQRGYTQENVSKNAGIERSYYTMIEQGNRNPSVSVAKSIASTLGFEWTIFFDNQGNETKQIQAI